MIDDEFHIYQFPLRMLTRDDRNGSLPGDLVNLNKSRVVEE